MQMKSKSNDNDIDLDGKITLMFKRKYKKKLEDGEITQNQYNRVVKLIKNRHDLSEKEFNEKLIEIFPESEEGIRKLMEGC